MKIIFSQTTRICRSCEWQLLSDAKESRNDPVPGTKQCRTGILSCFDRLQTLHTFNTKLF